MSDALDQKTENVTFSLFGITFTLRVTADKIKGLRESIASIQSKSLQMMRENPTLSPQQTAVLIALESENRLRDYLENSSPFEALAQQKIETIKATLKHNLNGN